MCRDGIQLAKVRLPVSATSPRAARDLVGIMAAQWGLPDELAFAARLAVCELVTNTLLHCAGMPGSTVFVIVSRHGAMFRVEVHDGSGGSPRIRHPRDTEETGRGLMLVSEMTDECGHHPTAFGKAVWFAIKTHWPLDHSARQSGAHS
ncbi:ATP-binding protein [Actinomadura scrupuli]|uniref:ATP-binding protein n=1 Tax=Actinomadura scrupuli TaxID=559629 RepID=UPI003D96A530